ncbi:UNVERIFIED_CONTAM: hypothetical protein FKN15_047973 [Acipenser sinensis]
MDFKAGLICVFFFSQNDGRLRLSKQAVVYKNSKTGRVDNIAASDLTGCFWRRVSLGHGVRLETKSGNAYKYDGFRESAFSQQVLSKADVIQATGDAVCIFRELQCLTPRGRYDIRIYPSFLHLHGKTFDYKIPYTTVLRLFLLPHKDQRQMFFVISLDPPIKQGQTRYHFLILLFSKEEDLTLTLNMTEDDVEKRFAGKLSRNMSGSLYEMVSRVMKALVNRKITVPGNFQGHSGAQCITCSYKASSGLLYPLERGFIFVHKPPLHLRFDEVSCVNFARGTTTTRSFDFEIESKQGGQYTFSSIERYCNTIQYNTIQYNTIQYNTIQYNTIQYNTIQASRPGSVSLLSASRPGSVSLLSASRPGSVSLLSASRPGSVSLLSASRAGSVSLLSASRAGSVCLLSASRAGSVSLLSASRAGSVSLLSASRAGSVSLLSASRAGSVALLSAIRAGSVSLLSASRAGSVSLLSASRAGSVSLLSASRAGSVSLLSASRAGSVSLLSASRAGSSSGEGGGSDEEEERKKPAKKPKLVKEKVERKPRKKAEGKKQKDPGAPKRPLSTYMLWLNANRDKIRAEYPGISITEVSKKAGELWKNMTKENKEVRRERGREREGGTVEEHEQ